MPILNVILNGLDGIPQLMGVKPDDIIELQTPITVGVIPDGMTSGKPSVFFVFEFKGGKLVFAESSYALFIAAAKALQARYGEPT